MSYAVLSLACLPAWHQRSSSVRGSGSARDPSEDEKVDEYEEMTGSPDGSFYRSRVRGGARKANVGAASLNTGALRGRYPIGCLAARLRYAWTLKLVSAKGGSKTMEERFWKSSRIAQGAQQEDHRFEYYGSWVHCEKVGKHGLSACIVAPQYGRR